MARSSSILAPLSVYGQTHPGRQRTNNEDNLAWRHARDPQRILDTLTEKVSSLKTGYADSVANDLIGTHGRLYIVADGVGGNDDGEKASLAVVEEVTRAYYGTAFDPYASREAQLDAAIQHATREIFTMAVQDSSNTASTLVAALVWDNAHERCVQFANVGDSRGYLFQAGAAPDDDAIKTVDHVLSGNRLSQSMGDRQVAPAFSEVLTLRPNDVIVLCSDGLSDLLDAREIGAIACAQAPQNATSELIARANERGGHDNITALVIRNGPAPVAWGAIAKFGGAMAGVLAAFLAIFLFAQSASGGDLPRPRATVALATRETIRGVDGKIVTVTLPPAEQATDEAERLEATSIAATNAAVFADQTARAVQNPPARADDPPPPAAPPVNPQPNRPPTARPVPPTARPALPATSRPGAPPAQSTNPPAAPPTTAPAAQSTEAPPPPAQSTEAPPPPAQSTEAPPPPPPTDVPPPPPTEDTDRDDDGTPDSGDACPDKEGPTTNGGCPRPAEPPTEEPEPPTEEPEPPTEEPEPPQKTPES